MPRDAKGMSENWMLENDIRILRHFILEMTAKFLNSWLVSRNCLRQY